METSYKVCSFSLPTRSAAEVESMLIVGAEPRSSDLQPPNREDVYPHLPFGQPSGRRSDSPPDGVADSPSGGPSKLGRSLGQPFRRHSRTAPREKRIEPMTSLRGRTHTVSSIRQGFAVQN